MGWTRCPRSGRVWSNNQRSVRASHQHGQCWIRGHQLLRKSDLRDFCPLPSDRRPARVLHNIAATRQKVRIGRDRDPQPTSALHGRPEATCKQRATRHALAIAIKGGTSGRHRVECERDVELVPATSHPARKRCITMSKSSPLASLAPANQPNQHLDSGATKSRRAGGGAGVGSISPTNHTGANGPGNCGDTGEPSWSRDVCC